MGVRGSTWAYQEGPRECSTPPEVSGDSTTTYDVGTETLCWLSATPMASGDRTEISEALSDHTSGLDAVIGTSIPEYEWTQQTQCPVESSTEIESCSTLHSGEEIQTAKTATSPADASIPTSLEGTEESEATTAGIVVIFFL